MAYDFSKISHEGFVLKYKDPFNPTSLIPSNLDLPSAGKKYVQGDVLSTAMTQISRYSKKRKLDADNEWIALTGFVADLFKKRFLKKNIITLTNDRIAKHINPVIEKLNKNGGAFKDLNFALAPLSEKYTIHFFLKDITKVVLAKTLDADKCGQGISAWSKQLNALFCPLFRAIEECFTLSLKDNIIYHNGIKETDYDRLVAENFDHDIMQFINDFKEYDSNQDADTQFLEDVILEIFCDKKFLRLYRAMRLKAKQKSVIISLINEALKNSGESATLFTNTIVNMVYSVLTTEVNDVRLEGYKGDDSFINAGSIKMTNVLLKHYENCKAHLLMKSDCDFPLHTDFSGDFMSEFGVVPDVLKIMGKFLSKDFLKNKNKQLTEWERKNLKVEGLSYFEQVKASLVDKCKYLNEKKLIYLRRVYRDIYQMSDESFVKLINTFLYYASDESTEIDNLKWGGFYSSDLKYIYTDMSEADKNRKRNKHIHKSLDITI